MFCKPDVSDLLKPDVLKPDVLKPDVLWVYQAKKGNFGKKENTVQKQFWVVRRLFLQSGMHEVIYFFTIQINCCCMYSNPELSHLF
jgi:hypothetical protein